MTRAHARRSAALLAAVLLSAGFCALGVWQLERLAWKLDLIARVEARVHAATAQAPGPPTWPAFAPKAEEYRHVQVRGTFDNSHETLTQAVTILGPGYWVMTPLRTDQGYTVLINRGFVPDTLAGDRLRVAGRAPLPTAVTGLLRLSEPHGGFLRANDPGDDRWYSRDVSAIGATRGLSQLAPYFIDADASINPGDWPRGGLTVVRFRNPHLIYALTWFGLAIMSAALGAWPLLQQRRRARVGPAAPPYGAGVTTSVTL